MNATLDLILKIFIGLAVLMILLAASGYALHRVWLRQLPQKAKMAGANLRDLSSQLSTLGQAAQAFPITDPEPYTARAVLLHKALSELENRQRVIYQQYISIQQILHRAPAAEWRGIIQVIPDQYQLRMKLADLTHQRAELSADLVKAQDALTQLAQAPIEVSHQAHQVQESLQAASLALAGLHDRHIQGKAFQEAAAQETQLKQQFSQIPLAFLAVNPGKLLGSVNKADTIAVHQQLSMLSPALERLHDQLRTWGTLHEQASASHSALQGALARAGALLESIPDTVQVDAERQQLTALSTKMSTLKLQLGEPEAEDMLLITQEAVSATNQAQVVAQRLEQTGQQAVELAQVTAAAQAVLQDLTSQIDSLARHPAAALVWDVSGPRQLENQNTLAAVGSPSKSRNPDQIAADLSQVRQAAARLDVLQRQVAQSMTLHQSLCQHLGQLERSTVLSWVEKVAVLGDQIKAYDPANWPDHLDAGSFANQLDDFAAAFRRYFPAKRSLSIKESALPDRVAEVGRLAREYTDFQSRAVSLRQDLVDLQHRETQARAVLDDIGTLFRQVTLIAKSNLHLEELARPELARLTNEASQAAAAFKQPRIGTMDKKALRVEALQSAAERAANRWLQALDQENLARRLALRGSLDGLKQVALFDDSTLKNANDLITSSLHLTATRGDDLPELSLESIFLPLKKANEEWQNLLAAQHAVKDIERPIVEAYQRALQAREKARKLLGEPTKRLARSEPANPIIEGYKAEFTALELHWQALRSQPVRVLPLLGRLGDLTTRYELVAEKASQQIDRAQPPELTP